MANDLHKRPFGLLEELIATSRHARNRVHALYATKPIWSSTKTLDKLTCCAGRLAAILTQDGGKGLSDAQAHPFRHEG